MTCIGFDHHKKWTQAAAIDDQGKIIREMRVLNDNSSLKGFLKGLPKPLKGVVVPSLYARECKIGSNPPFAFCLSFSANSGLELARV